MSAATSPSRKPGGGNKCPVCGRTFASAQLLEEHKKVDHGSSSSPPAGVS
ncbi:MAG: hypothetical protein AB1753_03000 [Thermoproteota archaeon]